MTYQGLAHGGIVAAAAVDGRRFSIVCVKFYKLFMALNWKNLWPPRSIFHGPLIKALCEERLEGIGRAGPSDGDQSDRPDREILATEVA
jgi:hypothetical protein